MMTQRIKGQNVARAQELFDEFHKMLTQPGAELDYDVLEDLETLAGVAEYPTRIKCAILAWHTLHAALEGNDETVRTE
jgi:nitrogen fixation NifU-like protein